MSLPSFGSPTNEARQRQERQCLFQRDRVRLLRLEQTGGSRLLAVVRVLSQLYVGAEAARLGVHHQVRLGIGTQDALAAGGGKQLFRLVQRQLVGR